jgi:chromosome segregation ATPase
MKGVSVMAKTTKAELEGDVALLEMACDVYVKELEELKKQIVKFEKLKSASQTSHANLVTDKINLTKELKSSQAKVKIFHDLLKDSEEHAQNLQTRITDTREGMDEFEEDVLEQFRVLATCVDNARTMILG